MTKQYVIRSFEFAYNDEYYQLDGDLGAIQAVFDDAASAQAEMERLTVARLRAEDELCSYEPFTEPEANFVERMDTFCVARCGKPLFDDDAAYSLPEGLSDADVLELAQLAGFHPYQVAELPADGCFVALWLLDEAKYAGTYSVNIAYQSNVEAFMENVPFEIQSKFPDALHGTLEDLSHSPLLLRQLLASKPDLSYDEAKQTLSFKAWRVAGADLFALNALLKKPVFEIRRLTVAELQAMKA